MVKKLFKHEFLAYLRVVLPMHIILLFIALFNRITQLFESTSSTYDIIFGSSMFIYIIALIVCIVLTFIFGIKRFYSNLFTHEGYLTLTLPVTPAQHILVKATVATTSILFSLVMAFASLLIITFGEVGIEIFKAIGFLYNEAYPIVGFNLILYIAEFVLVGIVSIATSYLLYYACICIGQRAKKSRVAAAIAVYFIYYVIVQVLGTIFMVLLPKIVDVLPLDKLADFATAHPHGMCHIIMGAWILFTAIMGFVYFIISKHIVSKKLNIE